MEIIDKNSVVDSYGAKETDRTKREREREIYLL
jgi:hypothetical protein